MNCGVPAIRLEHRAEGILRRRPSLGQRLRDTTDKPLMFDNDFTAEVTSIALVMRSADVSYVFLFFLRMQVRHDLNGIGRRREKAGLMGNPALGY
jgi:hypothetical protein